MSITRQLNLEERLRFPRSWKFVPPLITFLVLLTLAFRYHDVEALALRTVPPSNLWFARPFFFAVFILAMAFMFLLALYYAIFYGPELLLVTPRDVRVFSIIRVREVGGTLRFSWVGDVLPKFVIDTGRYIIISETGELRKFSDVADRIASAWRVVWTRLDIPVLYLAFLTAVLDTACLAMIALSRAIPDILVVLAIVFTGTVAILAFFNERMREKRALEHGYRVVVVGKTGIAEHVNPRVERTDGRIVVEKTEVSEDSPCLVVGRNAVVVDRSLVQRIITL